MEEFHDKAVWHNGDPISFSNAVLTGCSFNQCDVRPAPDTWNRFSDISLRDASHWNCSISGAALENVTLHNLKKVGAAPLFFWGSVFRNVKMSGRISGIKINRILHIPARQPEQNHWDRQVLEYYESVDWAIDMSQAKFPGGTTFEAIPGHLIVRDPATQVLIKRKSLSDRDWRAMDFDGTAIDIAISWFESESLFDSGVIVARSDSKYATRDLQVLDMLRVHGIAEPD